MTSKQSDHTQTPPGDSCSIAVEASQRRAILHQASDLVCLRFGNGVGRLLDREVTKAQTAQQPIEASKQGVQERTKSLVA